MSVNIKTATGLKKISGEEVTKSKVEKALGYTPANDAEFDSHVADKTSHITQAERDNWNSKPDNFTDLEDAPNITEDESGELLITDNDGNIAVRVDDTGLHAAALNVGSTSLAESEDDETAFSIADGSGNIAFKVDSEATHVDTLKVNEILLQGGDIAESLSDVASHINNEVRHITTEERDAWNDKVDATYVEEALANLVNAAPEELDTLNELAAALGNDENFAATVTSQIASKADGAAFAAHVYENDNRTTTLHVTKEQRDNWAFRSEVEDLKSELSEGVSSTADSFVIADSEGRKAMEVDAAGNLIAAALKINNSSEETKASITNEGHLTAAKVSIDGMSKDVKTTIEEEISRAVSAESTLGTRIDNTNTYVGMIPDTAVADSVIEYIDEEISNLENEMSEEISSNSDSWTLVDNNGNKIAEFSQNGLETTAVKLTYDSGEVDEDGKKVLASIDVKTKLDETTSDIVSIKNNYALKTELPKTVTTTANGLMIAADKVKLDGIEAEANKTIIENNLTTETTGHALDAKQGKELAAQIASTASVINNFIDSVPDWSLEENKPEYDYSEINNAPNIEESDGLAVSIADNDGNIVAKVSESGLETTAVNITYDSGRVDGEGNKILETMNVKETMDIKASLYIGTGDMPEGYDIQIDPDGEAFIVPVNSGGTGATTAAAARENLGAAPAYQYSSTDLTAGTSELATGTLYFTYE